MYEGLNKLMLQKQMKQYSLNKTNGNKNDYPEIGKIERNTASYTFFYLLILVLILIMLVMQRS